MSDSLFYPVEEDLKFLWLRVLSEKLNESSRLDASPFNIQIFEEFFVFDPLDHLVYDIKDE